MRKTYTSKCEVGPSNAKYVIKFNFKYITPSDPRRPLATNFRNKYMQHIQEAS